jgi:hypothetical protein
MKIRNLLKISEFRANISVERAFTLQRGPLRLSLSYEVRLMEEICQREYVCGREPAKACTGDFCPFYRQYAPLSRLFV